MNGKREEALRTFDRGIALGDPSEELRLNRGVTLLQLGRVEEASKAFAALADEGDELRPQALFHHALALDRMQRLAESAAALEKALAADATFDAALLYLGVVREKQGDFQAAGRAYRDYLKRRPDAPVALLRFGVVAHRSGHVETAMSYLRRVQQVSPRSSEAVEAQKYLVMWE